MPTRANTSTLHLTQTPAYPRELQPHPPSSWRKLLLQLFGPFQMAQQEAQMASHRHIMETMGALVALRQLGYGTSQGAEAAVHAAHLFLDNLQPSEVILKLNFKSAFDTIYHDRMMNAIRSLIHELTPFVHSVCGEPSTLSWGR